MENLKSPAHPLTHWETADNGNPGMFSNGGFTKLELASLMIATGLASDPSNILTDPLAKLSVAFAKSVLEEANK